MSNTTTTAMETSARYSALEHGGLEVMDRPDGPEVVPGSSPPLERRSSLNQPETLHHGQYEPDQKQEHGNYYLGDTEAAAPSYADETKPSYMHADAKEPVAGAQEIHPQRDGRRYCGMRRAVFIGSILGLIVIILAAVLGGVLGTVLTHHHTPSSTSSADNITSSSSGSSSSSSSLAVMANSGFAATISADGSGRFLMYYQDPEGRIIENSYLDNNWTLEDSSRIDQSVVTDEATPGSPLAAISYTLNSTQYRQVFFIDSTGLVKTTNATATTGAISSSWSSPYAIASDTASTSGTVGLAACVDNKGANGIRVYYGSSYDCIQEVGYQFNDTAYGWEELNAFEESDPNSGVACVVYNADDDLYINVYMRNSSGMVYQNFFDFEANDGWEVGPIAYNNTIAPGSAIAACNDDTDSEYVYYQMQGGMVVRGLVDPAGSSFEQFSNMQGASNATKLATAFVDGGALLLFQNNTNASTVWAVDVSRSGYTIMDTAVP